MIKQTITFDTTPQELYALLLDSKIMSKIHGGKTTMTKKANGKFTVFDGYCRGYNIEIVEGKKIEQAWYFAEEGWPEDHYSICTFALAPSGKGTELTFTQSGVPLKTYKNLVKGWHTYYWNPIEQFLQGNKN